MKRIYRRLLLLGIFFFAFTSIQQSWAYTVNNIHSVYMIGQMNGWRQNDPNWQFDWGGDGYYTAEFYIPHRDYNYEFKLFINYNGGGNGYYGTYDGYWFTESATAATGLANTTYYPNMQIKCINAESGFIKLDCKFWGNWYNDSKLEIKQYPVLPLQVTSFKADATYLSPGEQTRLTYSFSGGSGNYNKTLKVVDNNGIDVTNEVLNGDNFTFPVSGNATSYTITCEVKDSHPFLADLAAAQKSIIIKPKYYRLVSTLQDGSSLYSNEVFNNGDIMSVYTQSAGTLQLQCIGVDGWENVGKLIHHTENNVIVTPLIMSEGVASMGAISNYTGNYYIRTDVAAGGWNNYKQESNQFTYFEPNPLFANETYNHYWVNKINSGNCKARIANDYNNSLSTEIGDYNVAENRETNLRFSYNNTTNVFERTFMSGSTSDDFLLIYGTNIETTTGGNMDESAKQKFTDISNWVYEYDLKASPGTTINIESNYPYQTTKSLVENAIILGEHSTQNGSTQYDMRVIYDFKKNRWIASWLPDLGDITIENQKINVYANLMLVRKHNKPVNSIKITGNGYIDHLQRIYFVMELERDTLFNIDGSKKFSHLFWFSLPYNCKISDIFGIEGYGKKWVIQRYRGDKRAELSWTTNIKTFWANMKSTATLEANQGYVLALNLTASDFQDIGGKSVLRLYFPSDESNFKLSKNSNMTVTIPEHKCTVSVRDSVDSNWNVIGIPGFQPVNMQSYAEANGFDGFEDNKVPNFLYEWGGENGLYHVKDGKTMTYQHFYSYMVQFAGTINWGQFTQGNTGTPASVRAQRSPQANREETFRIDLTGESNADRTFIRLSDNGTEGYVPNQDLEKLINGQYAQIYSLGAGTHLAANTLPREMQTVLLGLNIPANGTYSLDLHEGGQAITAILYDKWENVSTDLSRNSYEFTQMEGRCEDRFEIQFSAEPTVPTDVEEAREAFIRVDGRTLRVLGGHEGGCVAVYDMAGRCLLSTQLTADFSFEVPVAGVYVVEYQGKRNKVVIR